MTKIRNILYVVFTAIVATERLCMAKVSEEDLFPVFDRMDEYGTNAKNDLLKRNISWNQFVTIFVTSEEDIKDKMYETSFKTRDESRLRVKFNQNRSNDRADHGEILVMEELEGMVKIFKKPLVLLFSYYIPCSEVKNLGYSCAEKLGEYQKGHSFQIIVAYKMVYKGTNVGKSVSFLTNAGIKTFEKIPDGVYFETSNIFQTSFYQCLIRSPKASGCCTGEEENRRKIVAFFTNVATFEALANSTRKAEITKGTAKNVQKSLIDKFSIGRDCDDCSDNLAIQSSITYCANRAFSVSTIFGAPEGNTYPYDPTWRETKQQKWCIIYDQHPVTATRHREMVMCTKRTNSLQSLCTKHEVHKSPKRPLETELLETVMVSRNNKHIKQQCST